jgi:hypothetical protein
LRALVTDTRQALALGRPIVVAMAVLLLCVPNHQR